VAYAYDAHNNQLYVSKFDFMHGDHCPEENEDCARDFAKGYYPDIPLNIKESDWHCPE
jgi:hypothetical protein